MQSVSSSILTSRQLFLQVRWFPLVFFSFFFSPFFLVTFVSASLCNDHNGHGGGNEKKCDRLSDISLTGCVLCTSTSPQCFPWGLESLAQKKDKSQQSHNQLNNTKLHTPKVTHKNVSAFCSANSTGSQKCLAISSKNDKRRARHYFMLSM